MTQDLELDVGTATFDLVLGQGIQQKVSNFNVGGRAEWAFALSSRIRATAGLDLKNEFFRGSYAGVQPTDTDGVAENPLGTQRRVSSPANLSAPHPAIYAELGVRPWDALLVTPGVRVDWFANFGRVAVDPRISARLEISPVVTLKGGVGASANPRRSGK